MAKRANLDNLTKGPRPALHTADPNWDTLKGLVERAAQSIADAQALLDDVRRIFPKANP